MAMDRKSAVVFVTDQNYFAYVLLVVKRLRYLNFNRDCFVLLDSANEWDLHDTNLPDGVKIINIFNEMNLLTGLAASRHVSRTTYGKFLIPSVLPKEYEIVLYLDADIWIRESPDILLERKGAHGLGAVIELSNNGEQLFGTPHENYFNAGVLILNLDYWRERNVIEKFKVLFSKHGNLIYQDQDYLNTLFKNNFDPLPHTSNVFANTPIRHPAFANLRQPMIVHFNGPLKPWNSAPLNMFFVEWQQYARAVGYDLPKFRRHILRKFLFNQLYGSRQIFLYRWLRKILPLRTKEALISLFSR